MYLFSLIEIMSMMTKSRKLVS